MPHPPPAFPPPAATQIARNCFTSARMPSMLASLSACYQPQSLPTRPRPLARLDEVGLRRRTCGNAAAAHACRNSGHAAAAEYALGLDPSLGLCIALACTLPLYLAITPRTWHITPRTLMRAFAATSLDSRSSAPSCIRFLPRPATIVALLPSGAHFETKAQCRLLRRSGGHLVTPWSYVDHRRRRAPTPLLRARLPCACATLHNRTSPSASPCQS